MSGCRLFPGQFFRIIRILIKKDMPHYGDNQYQELGVVGPHMGYNSDNVDPLGSMIIHGLEPIRKFGKRNQLDQNFLSSIVDNFFLSGISIGLTRHHSG